MENLYPYKTNDSYYPDSQICSTDSSLLKKIKVNITGIESFYGAGYTADYLK